MGKKVIFVNRVSEPQRRSALRVGGLHIAGQWSGKWPVVVVVVCKVSGCFEACDGDRRVRVDITESLLRLLAQGTTNAICRHPDGAT